MKLKRLPRAWEALARKANREILLAEAHALRDLRASSRAAIQSARASIALDGVGVAEALRVAAPALSDAIRTSVLVGRMDAKKRSAAMLEDELDLADYDAVLETVELTEPDHTRATAVAAAIVAAWLMMGLATQSKDPPLAALEAIDFRLRRVAGTEIPEAYGAWHIDQASRLDTALLVQRWDATLDTKTCKLCDSMDGEIATLGESFRDGLIPGAVHPMCRCQPTIILASIATAA